MFDLMLSHKPRLYHLLNISRSAFRFKRFSLTIRCQPYSPTPIAKISLALWIVVEPYPFKGLGC